MCNPTVRCCQTRLMIRLRISILGNSGGLRMEQAGLFWCRTRAKSFLIKAVSLKFNTLFYSGLRALSTRLWVHMSTVAEPIQRRHRQRTDAGVALLTCCFHASSTTATRCQEGDYISIKEPQSLVRRLHSGHRTKIKINRSTSCLCIHIICIGYKLNSH